MPLRFKHEFVDLCVIKYRHKQFLCPHMVFLDMGLWANFFFFAFSTRFSCRVFVDIVVALT